MSAFVDTKALHAALSGREIEILVKLGIDWSAGKRIRCPFPDHEDHNPSFRWDEKAARAFCSCALKGADVLEIVMRMRRLEFGDAKLEAARLLGREDLILERGSKMNATALLSPPADQADRVLPRAYLAHRLQIEPDQVPMPATVSAGWKELDYWDPATKRGGKPRLVGKHPCAVFGTVAADGRTHAHRIYTTAGGAGKAELGEGRDPKKSATLKKGATSAGCAVLWGDRDCAPWVIVCEGIETGAAVAFAFRSEIAAGELLVASAISTGGVSGFDPWPAVQRVTVAADRDEDKKSTDKGYRAGERAAEKLAARHREIAVSIALPGKAGSKTDSLDLLLADGAEAVRCGVAAAKAPTPEEIEATQAAAGAAIRVYGGSLPQNVNDAERVLSEATRREPAKGVYQRGGALVRIARLPVATAADSIRRAAGSLQIMTAGPDFLRLRLTEISTWERFDKRSEEWVQTDAPAGVARTLADTAGMWPNIHNLAGIIEAPALRPDGTILDRPGFDEASGLYFDPGATEFPSIADRPTRRDAELALGRLLEILQGFPFVDEASRSVTLALLITPLVRYALRAAPLTAISAPKMGSGKTLLSHLPAYIATGRSPALMAQADDPQEEKKRLMALLLEGSLVTVLDNCERSLKSDALCTALTEVVIRDRILGSTRTISVPTATTWIATGNSLRVDGDLSSRTLLITLDPQCERPEEREFSVNLHDAVPRQRGELAAAALTIVRAYIAAGRPRQDVPTFGRFEGWSAFARDPLVWLGLADPCETRRAVEARDLVRDKLGNLLEAWHGVFADSEQTIGTAIQVTNPDQCGNPLSGTAQALRNALEAVGEDRGRLNARRIGNFISTHEGRIERSCRFERAGSRQGVALWSVSFVGFVGSATTARGNCQENNSQEYGNSRVDTFSYQSGTNPPNPPNPPGNGTAAGVAFRITEAMKAELRKRGWTDAGIHGLKPAEAHNILNGPADPRTRQ